MSCVAWFKTASQRSVFFFGRVLRGWPGKEMRGDVRVKGEQGLGAEIDMQKILLKETVHPSPHKKDRASFKGRTRHSDPRQAPERICSVRLARRSYLRRPEPAERPRPETTKRVAKRVATPQEITEAWWLPAIRFLSFLAF